MCDLRRFLERLTRFNPKLAPNKALPGAAEIISLGHKISSEGVGPDPDKVKAIEEMPMPQNVNQLRSLLGGQPLKHDHSTPCYEKEPSSSSHGANSASSEKC